MADTQSTKAADLPRDIYVMYKKKFDNFDLNKDGVISVAEFTSVSKVFGYSLTDDDIQEIFGKIDGNQDGGICFEEFVAAMQKRAKKVKDMAPLREKFRVYDTKQRGYITTDEAYPVLSRELGFDENKTGSFVDMFDKNKDYQISLLEFVSFQKRVEELKAQIETAFKECDTDADGFISAVELNAVMSKKGQSMSDAEGVIAKYDVNGDGKLDYQEFATYYNVPIF